MDIWEIRRRNLQLLVNSHGGTLALAARAGIDPPHLYRMLATPPKKRIGDRTATKIERNLDLAPGTMSSIFNTMGLPVQLDEALLTLDAATASLVGTLIARRDRVDQTLAAALITVLDHLAPHQS